MIVSCLKCDAAIELGDGGFRCPACLTCLHHGPDRIGSTFTLYRRIVLNAQAWARVCLDPPPLTRLAERTWGGARMVEA